jgi:hypothetical protein
MGTRLYPEVKDVIEYNDTHIALLERCAKVPLGTFKQLEEFENNYVAPIPFDGENQDTEEDYQKYCARIELPELNKLYMFINFGWGRLSNQAYDLIESWGLDSCCGRVDEPERVTALLNAMDITVDVDVPCLCWS